MTNKQSSKSLQCIWLLKVLHLVDVELVDNSAKNTCVKYSIRTVARKPCLSSKVKHYI